MIYFIMLIAIFYCATLTVAMEANFKPQCATCTIKHTFYYDKLILIIKIGW